MRVAYSFIIVSAIIIVGLVQPMANLDIENSVGSRIQTSYKLLILVQFFRLATYVWYLGAFNVVFQCHVPSTTYINLGS